MEIQEPYGKRDTSPYFFYPMFHPSKHLLSLEEIDTFCSTLERRSEKAENASLYIHIPFCDSFCHMCACYKTHAPQDPEVFDRYIKGLKTEIRFYASTPYVSSQEVDFIYFGGGTPSTLPPRHIEQILSFIRQHIRVSKDAAISFEGDVRTLSDEARLEALKSSGCNRISFGVQTFHPPSRKQSGLVPKIGDIVNCIEKLRCHGYKINFDLMFGLPGQDIRIWEQDLETAVELGADGLDLYETVVYPTTKLFRFRHRLTFAGDRERTDMLCHAISFLKENRFVQRTKAIFQKPDNLLKRPQVMYHAGPEDIIAIGDSAIGFLNGFVYRNLSPLGPYLDWNWKETGKPPLRLGIVPSQRERFTRNMTRLPKCLGIGKSEYHREIEYFKESLERLKEKKLVQETVDEIRLTDLGLLWTDNIIADFVSYQDRKRAWKIMY